MVVVNTVVYVQDILGRQEADVAIALAAFGAGSMLAALGLPSLLDYFSDRPVLMFGGFTLPAALALGLFMPDFLGLLIIWFVVGASASLIQTPAGRLITRAAEPGLQPSLFAAHFVLTHAGWMVFYPLAGWSASISISFAFTTLALFALTGLGLASWVWRPQTPVKQKL